MKLKKYFDMNENETKHTKAYRMQQNQQGEIIAVKTYNKNKGLI